MVIEPAGILWSYMADHWPKTKFIQLTREINSWKKSFILGFKRNDRRRFGIYLRLRVSVEKI